MTQLANQPLQSRRRVFDPAIVPNLAAQTAFRYRHDDPVLVNVKSDIRDMIPHAWKGGHEGGLTLTLDALGLLFSMMRSGSAVQTKGWGLRLCSPRSRLIAACRSTIEWKAPRCKAPAGERGEEGLDGIAF
jgi:hypothetical protein